MKHLLKALFILLLAPSAFCSEGAFYLKKKGVQLKNEGKLEEAFSTYLLALEESKKEKNDTLKGKIYLNLGHLSIIQGELSQALEYLTTGIRTHLEIPYHEDLGAAYTMLGTAYSKQKNFIKSFQTNGAFDRLIL